MVLNIKKILCKEGGIAIVGCVYDTLTARATAEAVGQNGEVYQGVWLSSLVGNLVQGLPDIDLPVSDRIAQIPQIRMGMGRNQLPMLYDGDSGGDIEAFKNMIARLQAQGVFIVVIEDKIDKPGEKENSLKADAHQPQDTPENFAAKIRATKAWEGTSPDFAIIARIESFICGETMEQALARADAYIEAGADAILIHSKSKAPDQVLEFGQGMKQKHPDVPLVAIPTTYPDVTDEQLQKAGINAIIYANQIARVVNAAAKECAAELLNGRMPKKMDPVVALTGMFTRESLEHMMQIRPPVVGAAVEPKRELQQ